MKILFTAICAISFLICLAFLGIGLMTLGGKKEFKLKDDAQHDYALKFDGFDINYEGRLKTFGPRGFKTQTSSSLGITTDKQIREADPRASIEAGEGKLVQVPAFYPIAIFGILPVIWVVGQITGLAKKPKVPPPTM